MRIDATLLNPDSQGPWSDIAKRCARKYQRATGKPFEAEMLEHAAVHSGRPTIVEDPVVWGFARKAVRRMRVTCSICGAEGKSRPQEDRGAVRCASCQLPLVYRRQLERVLRDDGDSSGEGRAVWAEHDVPPLMRSAIPEHCWRSMPVPHAAQLRYLTARDVVSLSAWLVRLGMLLEEDACRRAERRKRFRGALATANADR